MVVIFSDREPIVKILIYIKFCLGCDRQDLEAEIMQQATDPQIVLNILQDNLESTEA